MLGAEETALTNAVPATQASLVFGNPVSHQETPQMVKTGRHNALATLS